MVSKEVLMRMMMFLAAVAIACGTLHSEDRELPLVNVHEWGVLSWDGPAPVFTGNPEAAVPDPGGVMLRAPVLYFHGPEFTGTVTVKTSNGLMAQVYPEPTQGGAGQEFCSWTGSFGYPRAGLGIRGMTAAIDRLLETGVPAWPLHLWRTGESMTVTTSCAVESFLYYETLPVDTGFLPYIPGAETVAGQWSGTEAIVIRRSQNGVVYSRCFLEEITGRADMAYSELHPDRIHDILREWSRDIIDLEEVDALWNTWTQWICREHMDGGTYANGLVLYLVPESLLHEMSTIEVEAEAPSPYPFRVRRFILAAVPL